MSYTIIDHDRRREFDLTLNEYAICDSIYYLSRGGVCTASKEYLGEFIGISKQAVHKILNKLEKSGLINRKKSGILTTEKWNDAILESHGVNKVYSDSKQSLPQTVNKVYSDSKQSLPNNNIYNNNNNNNNIEAQERFTKLKNHFHEKYKRYHNDTILNWQKETIQLKNILKQNDDDIIRKLKLFEANIDSPPDKFWQDMKFLPSIFYSQWDKLTPKRKKKSIYEDLPARIQ